MTPRKSTERKDEDQLLLEIRRSDGSRRRRRESRLSSEILSRKLGVEAHLTSSFPLPFNRQQLPSRQPLLSSLHIQSNGMDLDLSWLQLVRLPPLRYDEDGEETDDPNGTEAPPPPFLSDASRLIKLAGVKIGYIECYVLRRDEMVDREYLRLSSGLSGGRGPSTTCSRPPGSLGRCASPHKQEPDLALHDLYTGRVPSSFG